MGAIACYVEGLKDGRSFLLAADRAARRGVPVVAVKVGRTETGARTAASHTGKLTGADAVVDAAMRQYGVIRVDGLDELQDTAALLARARPPVADGVVVYSISGGTGAHFADLATEAGLRLPELSQGKQAELHQWIPEYLSVANPVDNGGHPVGDWRGRKIIDAILDDPEVGVLICPVTGPFPPLSDRLVRDLVDAAEQTDKLVCVVWGSPVGTEPAYREVLLGSSRVATFRTVANCITAVRAHLDHHRFATGYRSPFDSAARTLSPSFRKARALMRPGQQLSEHAAKQLLRAYGIRVPREQLVTSAAAAVRAAGLVGYPVVMKASGARIADKTELGLVKIGLTSASQVRDAYRELTDIARYEDVPLDGVLVCQMVERGVEMVVGVTHDDLFGPTVTVGLGGVLVEVLRDTAVRVPPFGEEQARDMCAELRGGPSSTGSGAPSGGSGRVGRGRAAGGAHGPGARGRPRGARHQSADGAAPRSGSGGAGRAGGVPVTEEREEREETGRRRKRGCGMRSGVRSRTSRSPARGPHALTPRVGSVIIGLLSDATADPDVRAVADHRAGPRVLRGRGPS
ncbi:hypothetical protein SALBM311S_12479 [Streptomyces alboniger]